MIRTFWPISWIHRPQRLAIFQVDAVVDLPAVLVGIGDHLSRATPTRSSNFAAASARLAAELRASVREVAGDRVRTKAEALGDIPVRQPVARQIEDLEFALTQCGSGRATCHDSPRGRAEIVGPSGNAMEDFARVSRASCLAPRRRGPVARDMRRRRDASRLHSEVALPPRAASSTIEIPLFPAAARPSAASAATVAGTKIGRRQPVVSRSRCSHRTETGCGSIATSHVSALT